MDLLKAPFFRGDKLTGNSWKEELNLTNFFYD